MLLTFLSVATQTADRHLFGSTLSQLDYFQLIIPLDDQGVGEAPLLGEAGDPLHPALLRVQAWLSSVGLDLPYLVASVLLVGVVGAGGSFWLVLIVFWLRCGGMHALSLPLRYSHSPPLPSSPSPSCCRTCVLILFVGPPVPPSPVSSPVSLPVFTGQRN